MIEQLFDAKTSGEDRALSPPAVPASDAATISPRCPRARPSSPPRSTGAPPSPHGHGHCRCLTGTRTHHLLVRDGISWKVTAVNGDAAPTSADTTSTTADTVHHRLDSSTTDSTSSTGRNHHDHHTGTRVAGLGLLAAVEISTCAPPGAQTG